MTPLQGGASYNAVFLPKVTVATSTMQSLRAEWIATRNGSSYDAGTRNLLSAARTASHASVGLSDKIIATTRDTTIPGTGKSWGRCKQALDRTSGAEWPEYRDDIALRTGLTNEEIDSYVRRAAKEFNRSLKRVPLQLPLSGTTPLSNVLNRLSIPAKNINNNRTLKRQMDLGVPIIDAILVLLAATQVDPPQGDYEVAYALSTGIALTFC